MILMNKIGVLSFIFVGEIYCMEKMLGFHKDLHLKYIFICHQINC